MKMICDLIYRKDEISFKGDMIENEFYKSVDDVLDWDNNGDIIQVVFDDYFMVLYLKEKNRN